MKYFFKGIAWLSTGLGMAALVAALAFLAKYDLAVFSIPAGVWKNPPFEFQTPYPLLFLGFGTGLIGVILSALGLLGVKPPFLWISWLGFGICYCVLLISVLAFETALDPPHFNSIGAALPFFVSSLSIIAPGIMGIIFGLIIRPRRA